MKRLSTVADCYAALHDALDVIKAVQAAQNGNRVTFNQTARVALGEARAALDVAAQEIERAK